MISTRWFPKCDFSAKHDMLVDNVFADFDQQAEQLVGHDQTYLQLTPGAFRGRFLSAFLGDDVAIHMEYSNQALEQEVGGSPNHISFGVVLSDQGQFIANGTPLTRADVFVIPQSGNLHLVSPVNGAVMAIAIRREMFLRQPGLAPAAMEWVNRIAGNVGFLHMGRFADRLREDAMAALEGVAQTGKPASDAVIGQALAASITSKLSLEWTEATANSGFGGTIAFDRFQNCRNRLRTSGALIDRASELSKLVQGSKRSVEQAFSATVSVGPLTYLRLLRLHDVKRKLSDPSIAHLSIGDIAAEHGFWDWSRFSQHYRRHFGELPSTTRQYLAG